MIYDGTVSGFKRQGEGISPRCNRSVNCEEGLQYARQWLDLVKDLLSGYQVLKALPQIVFGPHVVGYCRYDGCSQARERIPVPCFICLPSNRVDASNKLVDVCCNVESRCFLQWHPVYLPCLACSISWLASDLVAVSLLKVKVDFKLKTLRKSRCIHRPSLQRLELELQSK